MVQLQALIDQNNNIRVGDKARSMPLDRMVDVKYACSVCEELYDTFEEADACAKQGYDDGGLKVGDLVIVPGSRLYHFENFQKHWCAFVMKADPTSASHFDHDDSYVPYYVVTAIHTDGPSHRDRHRCLVTLCTLIDGKLWAGWNPANGDGHHAMFRPGVERDPRLDGGSSWWEDVQAGVPLAKQVLGAKPTKKLLTEAAYLAAARISTDCLL